MRATLLLGLTIGCAGDPKTSAEPGEGTTVLLDDPDLADFITERMDTARLPGLAVALVHDGEVTAAGAWGMANIEEDRAVSVDTVFNLASVSKTITAAAVMQAVEDGDLDLDADVNEVLPFDMEHPDSAEAITARMLLTHTSGIADNWDVLEGVYTDGDSPIALGDFLEGYLTPGGTWYHAGQNFGDAPGESYDYSNIGASLAGYLVEAASGEGFDAWTDDRIFSPLGMDECSWHLSDLDEEHIAMPYGWYSGDWEPYGFYGYPDYPDGLLRTSAPQLARFLAAFTAGGVYDGERILDADTVDDMLSAQIPDIDDTQGLIWYSWELGGDTVWGHNGGDDGVATEILFRPSDGAGVVVLANGDGDRWGPVEEIEEELLDLAAGE